MITSKLAVSVAFTFLLGGCVSYYQSVPEGPNTAKLSIRYIGNTEYTNVSIFAEGRECRGGGKVLLDPKSSSVDLSIPASVTSFMVQNINVTNAGYQKLNVKICGGVFTFRASPGAHYKYVQRELINGCEIYLGEYKDGKWENISNLLTKRAQASQALPGSPNRPFCSDTYN